MWKIVTTFLFFYVLETNAQQCSIDGKFAVNFTSCKTYEVCKSSVSYKYDCSTNSIFDPRNLTCQLDFICPDSDTCQQNGFYPDPNYTNSSYYIQCTQYGTNFAVQYLDCGPDKMFVADVVPSTTANCTNSTVPPEIPSTICETEGTFPEYYTNCTTYRVCKKSNTNTFVPFMYLCSTASYFDPWAKMCVIGYQCLEGKCVSEGLKGSDVNDPTGNHYYRCVKDSTGRLLPLYLSCGTNMKFNETIGDCV